MDASTKSDYDVYEVRPRKGKRGIDLISDALPFGRLWYTKPDDAVNYAQFFSRSHGAVIRVYDADGNVIETHAHKRFVIPRSSSTRHPDGMRRHASTRST